MLWSSSTCWVHLTKSCVCLCVLCVRLCSEPPTVLPGQRTNTPPASPSNLSLYTHTRAQTRTLHESDHSFIHICSAFAFSRLHTQILTHKRLPQGPRPPNTPAMPPPRTSLEEDEPQERTGEQSIGDAPETPQPAWNERQWSFGSTASIRAGELRRKMSEHSEDPGIHSSSLIACAYPYYSG